MSIMTIKCCPWTVAKRELCGRCIRCLLCRHCNSGLFGEDPVILRRAAAYFEQWDKVREERKRQMMSRSIQEVNAAHDNQGTAPTLASRYQ